MLDVNISFMFFQRLNNVNRGKKIAILFIVVLTDILSFHLATNNTFFNENKTYSYAKQWS